MEIAYKLFKKYVQRGDLEGIVSVGKKILIRPDLSKKMRITDNFRKGRETVYEDTRYSIRTTLNRSRKADMLKYFYEFPDVRFSERAYRLVARTYVGGTASREADTFFDRALRMYPESSKLKKLFLEYRNHTKDQRN